MADLDRAGRDELHYAALKNDVDLVRARLSAGVDPSLGDQAGLTPLHFAAQEGSFQAAEALLDAGAEVDALNKRRQTPLWTAVMNSRSSPAGEMVKLLLRRGADRDVESEDGISPFDLAQDLYQFPIEIFGEFGDEAR